MSDFDDVLERLLIDPGFQAAVAADPERALAGYRLAADERALLGAQFVAGEGAERTVETRTSKSGVVGLVGPVAAAFGVAVASAGSSSNADASGGVSGSQSFGEAPRRDSFGYAPPPGGSESFGTVGAERGTETFGLAGTTETFGTVVGSGGTLGPAPVAPSDYHTSVDVDGDGQWDAHTVYERADGGVDIVADVDGDGQIDFVGHDYNRDGLVDDAEFDNDRDGALETKMYDDTGDGWMDRTQT